MDDTKDIQNRGQIARFLDDTTIRTNPFGPNVSSERAYRRAERVVAAVFLLTKHISPDESVRARSREKGIILLTNILNLRDEMRSTGSVAFQNTLASIRELISLVRMLSVGGFVSPQNASIVAEALDELGNFLATSQRSTLSESVVLSKEEFFAGAVLSQSRVAVSDIKDILLKKDESLSEKDKIKKVVSDNTVRFSIRGEAIFQILKSKGELGIKDISSNLPEYSEKMIQRELAALTAMGRVKKSGFKRWSRYSLAG